MALIAWFASCVVPSQHQTEIAFGDVLTFRSPVRLEPTGGRGVDSDVGTWRGGGLTVLIDHGLFANPLTSYREGAGVEVFDEVIDGRPARVVSAPRAEGGRMAAVHFASLPGRDRPAKLTMVVEADGSVSAEALLALVRSIEFKQREVAGPD